MTQEQLKEMFINGTLLTEMFLHGNKETNKYIIGVQKDIYIFDETDQDEIMREVITNLNKHFKQVSMEYRNENVFRGWNIFDIFSDLKTIAYDVFCGQFVNEDTVIIYGKKHSHSVNSSLYLTKLAKQLNIKTWMTDESFENGDFTYIDANTKASFPDVGFHATSSRYLMTILKQGLRSNKNNGNWINMIQNANHRNTIFFSTNNEELLKYTNHARTFHKAHPIIIEFKIPDINYIVQEFEMERATGTTTQLRYELSKTNSVDKRAISNKPVSLSKEMGVYGYTNYILPNFIKAIWIPKEIRKEGEAYERSDFKRVLPKEAAKELGIFSF